MKPSIVQEHNYGCGIACFAFASDITYQDAAAYLGAAQANSDRFYVKDFAAALNQRELPYVHRYAKPHLQDKLDTEGAIVLIRRSKLYPTGHYLIRHHNQWMDPWINLPTDNRLSHARSGYREELPGEPMYILFLCR